MKKSDIGKTVTDSGWISPTGLFFECEDHGHADVAYDLVEAGIVEGYNPEIDINVKSYSSNDFNQIFERRGWTKLTNCSILFWTDLKDNSRARINTKQKQQVIHYMKSKGFKKIQVFSKYLTIDEIYNLK